MRIYFITLHKKKLRDGGYSVEQKYPMQFTDDDDNHAWFKRVSLNAVIRYSIDDGPQKIYMLKSRGRKVVSTNDNTLVDFVELIELKLPKMVDQFIRGDTWHP